MKPSDVSIALLTERLGILEAEHAVRKTMQRYMTLCDVPSNVFDQHKLASLFHTDAIWEGIGQQYTHRYGCLKGREHIISMLVQYLPPALHFDINVHFLSSECIQVENGQATGHWLLLQVSGMSIHVQS